MDESLQTLRNELDELREEFERLAALLELSAQRIRESRVCPESMVPDAVLNAINRFGLLRTRIAEATADHESSLEAASLDDLADALDQVQRRAALTGARRALREAALGVVDTVIGLRHRDKADFDPLLLCQSAARSLRVAIEAIALPEEHPDESALANREHPYCALLALSDDHQTLDDERVEDLVGRIENAFGRLLALAAVRGKLVHSSAKCPCRNKLFKTVVVGRCDLRWCNRDRQDEQPVISYGVHE
jgi:hypothetical protein